MFSSKLGDCNARMQFNTPIAGYAYGCHHTSLLILAMTCRHAICDWLSRDTCSPTEDHSCSSYTQSELNTLTQLSARHLQGHHQTSKALTALHPTYSSTQPPALLPDDHALSLYTIRFSPTWCNTLVPVSNQTDTTGSPCSLHHSSTLKFRDAPSFFIVVTGG